MLRLYNATATDFGSNGLGILKKAHSSKVVEIQNGLFELEFKYKVDDKYDLTEDMVVSADASPDLTRQAFRVYYLSKELKGEIEVKAQHISYDLLDNFVESIKLTQVTCEYALNHIFKSCIETNPFKGFSDIQNVQDYNIDCVNAYEAIKGTKGSIIDTYGLGAKILRDNYNIHVLNSRGSSNNVLLTYRKNLKELTATYDFQNVVTKIYPYALVDGVKITLPEKYIVSPRIGKYAREKIKYVDLTNENITTIEQLRNKAQRYFNDTKCDLPKANYKVDLTTNNAKYKELNKVAIDDEVIVRDLRLGINATARVVRVEYDPINKKYLSIELGDLINHLTNDKLGELEDKVNDIEKDLGNLDINIDVDDTKFPNTLPTVPQLKAKGIFATIDLSWTYESKSYYNYEVYASQIANFNPDTINYSNRIFTGKASSFVHEVKPHQTWYYKVRAGNTHNLYTLFSAEVMAETTKLSDAAEYFEEAAISDALIGTLNADRAWVNKFTGNYIDARNLSVTDGNGNKTLDIDSFGNVNLDVNSLNIRSKDIEGELAINMLPNSNFAMANKTDLWYFWQSDYAANGCSWYLDQHGPFPTGEGLGLSSHLNQSCTATSQTVSVEQGETYTLSLDLNVEQNVISAGVMFRYYDQEGNTIGEHKTDYTPGYHGRISLSMKMEDERIKKMTILIWNNGATVDNKEYVVVFFNRIQLQKGKVATPWKLGTNDTITTRISQILVDAEGIRNKVDTIEGDYVTGTQFTQTNNQFRYEFLNSGSDNELWNSDFSQGGRSWIRNDASRVIYETNAGYGGGGIPVNSGICIEDCTNATAHASQVIKPKNPNREKYRLGCWVHMSHVNNTHGEGYPMAHIYMTISYSDGSYGWFNQDLRDYVGNDSGWRWVDFNVVLDSKRIIQIDFNVFKRNTSGAMRVTQIYFREGDIPSNKWRSHPGEVHSNTTVVDGQGIEITHSSGAKSRMTHECNEFTAANGNKTLRIKDGGLNFFTWESPEMTGFIKPTSLAENAWHNGVALSTYANGDFIAIGHSDHADENGWKCYPYILVAKHDLPYQGYRQGINLNQRTLVHHPMNFFNVLYMASMKPLEFVGNTPYNSQIYGYDGGGLAIFGDNATRIGYRDGTTNKVGFEINEAHGYQNNCLLKLWGEFDFQNYRVHNFRAAYNLEPKNPYTKDKMKRQDKKLYTSYTTTNNEIRHSGKDTTSLHECIVEIPSNISENIQNDYIVHLTKYGRGDIWIKETNTYYFIVESDVENLGFSYEVVAKELEKADIETRFTKDYNCEVEVPNVEEPKDMSYIDITEEGPLVEMLPEHWKLYRRGE